MTNNPLLSKDHLPRFDDIQPQHVDPAVQIILQENRAKLAQILDNKNGFTWENLIEPLEAIHNTLNCMWSTVSHLNSVQDTPELREVYDKNLLFLVEYESELLQNVKLYDAVLSVKESKNYQDFTPQQKRVIDLEIEHFRLAGVGLKAQEKEEYRHLKKELSELESQFEHHVLDATQGWCLPIQDVKDLQGIPQHTLVAAKEVAEKKGLPGYVLTLDAPCYQAVMCYAENRNIRQQMYEAHHVRASELGPNPSWDNNPVIDKILTLRQKLAKLLGFNSFADYSLALKMLKKTDQVMHFLTELAKKSRPSAEFEMSELKQFAKTRFGIEDMQPWDVGIVAEQYCQANYQVSQEALRPYFPENVVLEGLFSITKTLFGVTVQPAKPPYHKWDPSVKLFEVRNEKGDLQGLFYLDLYARDNKRAGAWLGTCRNRIRWSDGSLQLPVAYLIANFAAPELEKPALLTHSDIVTLFHEFGHCLHHVITDIDYAPISGNNGVEWDAIELPSQLLENWCWEESVLPLISKHVETGQSLPSDLIKKLKKSKIYNAAMQMIRQLEFALFDFKIHLDPTVNNHQQVQGILDAIRLEFGVLPVIASNRFQNAFTHIFGGAYAAGYYSYKWAEVLASDVFEKFEQQGILNSDLGEKFKDCLLAKGGSKPSMDLFVDFMGRDPSVEALLRHSGLA